MTTAPVEVSPDEAAFLVRIRETPDDDTARLVYADWLDEHGRHAEAEFVRVQVEIATLLRAGKRSHADVERERLNAVGGGCCDRFADMKACDCLADADPRLGELQRRERELWNTKTDDGWLVSPDQLFPGGAHYLIPSDSFASAEPRPENLPVVIFRRGFVNSVICPAADWLAHGDVIAARHPVRAVTLTTRPEIEFGPISQTEIPDENSGPGGLIVHRYWSVRNGAGTRQYGASLAISGRDIWEGADRVERLRSRFIDECDLTRTVGGYLSARWPGVRFTLPEPARSYRRDASGAESEIEFEDVVESAREAGARVGRQIAERMREAIMAIPVPTNPTPPADPPA